MNRRMGSAAAVVGVLVALLLVGAQASVTTPTAQARASTTFPIFTSVAFGGDSWTNFDLVAQNRPDVDWTVDLIFWGNATVSKVYGKIGWVWPGSNAYMQVDDGTGPVWAASQGRKNTLCTATHFRLYADSDGYLSNPALGNYVIGTAHIDRNECSRTPSYGWNETAEATVATRAEAVWGKAAVQRNATAFPDGTATAPLLNNQISSSTSNHYWDNNGHPTLIRVP